MLMWCSHSIGSNLSSCGEFQLCLQFGENFLCVKMSFWSIYPLWHSLQPNPRQVVLHAHSNHSLEHFEEAFSVIYSDLSNFRSLFFLRGSKSNARLATTIELQIESISTAKRNLNIEVRVSGTLLKFFLQRSWFLIQLVECTLVLITQAA